MDVHGVALRRSWRPLLAICAVYVALAAACGTGESVESAKVTNASDLLDGASMEYPGAVAFVQLDNGLAVIDGAHDGGVAIAVPDEDGAHHWAAVPNAGRLDGIAAWRDSDVIHVAGHRCPRVPILGSDGDDGDRCPTAPIVATTFSAKTQEWTSLSTEIDTGGVVTDLGNGNGNYVLAVLSDGSPSTGLAVVDVSKHSITRLPDDAGTTGPMACPSRDQFVRVSSRSDGSSGGAKTLTIGPNMQTDDVTVELIGTDATRRVLPATGTGALDDAGRVSVVGCAQDGAILQGDQQSGEQAVAYLVRVERDGDSAVVSALPAGPYGGPTPAAYFTDLTSSAVLSKQVPIAENQEDRAGQFSVLAPSGEWTTATRPLAEGETVAINRDGGGYVVTISEDGMTLRSFKTQ